MNIIRYIIHQWRVGMDLECNMQEQQQLPLDMPISVLTLQGLHYCLPDPFQKCLFAARFDYFDRRGSEPNQDSKSKRKALLGTYPLQGLKKFFPSNVVQVLSSSQNPSFIPVIDNQSAALYEGILYSNKGRVIFYNIFCNSAPVKSSVRSAISWSRVSFSSSERKYLFRACTYYVCQNYFTFGERRWPIKLALCIFNVHENSEHTFNMANLPSFDGNPTRIILSNRPFLKRAGSRISSLLVAPIINT